MDNTPPGWIPHGNPSIDPNVNLTLDDITDDQEVKQEYIEAVKEQLKTVYDLSLIHISEPTRPY